MGNQLSLAQEEQDEADYKLLAYAIRPRAGDTRSHEDPEAGLGLSGQQLIKYNPFTGAFQHGRADPVATDAVAGDATAAQKR